MALRAAYKMRQEHHYLTGFRRGVEAEVESLGLAWTYIRVLYKDGSNM